MQRSCADCEVKHDLRIVVDFAGRPDSRESRKVISVRCPFLICLRILYGDCNASEALNWVLPDFGGWYIEEGENVRRISWVEMFDPEDYRLRPKVVIGRWPAKIFGYSTKERVSANSCCIECTVRKDFEIKELC